MPKVLDLENNWLAPLRDIVWQLQIDIPEIRFGALSYAMREILKKARLEQIESEKESVLMARASKKTATKKTASKRTVKNVKSAAKTAKPAAKAAKRGPGRPRKDEAVVME